MNQVSDLNLALAVNEAGAMPSLKIGNQTNADDINFALSEFVKSAGHANLVLCLDYDDLVNADIVKLIRQYKVSHVELFGALNSGGMTTRQEFDHVMSAPLYRNGLKFIQSTTKTIIRLLSPTDESNSISAYALKGSDSAGFTGKLSVSELFDQQIKLTPQTCLIPYGGIGTPGQVASYLKAGAAAVAVGTLFAATKESCLAESVKKQMVSAGADDLTKFSTTQQALILGDRDKVLADDTDNRLASLQAGVSGQGGLIYAGSAIDYVTKIKSVQEVVDYLTSEL